jgi:adhesin/invasin
MGSAAGRGAELIKVRSAHVHLPWAAAFLLLAAAPSLPQDCADARARDCNRNGIPDSFDLDPTFGFGEPQAIDGEGIVVAAAVADLDGDGAPDIAALRSKVLIYRNLGIGLFSLIGEIDVGADPFLVASGDLDADGDEDLAVGVDTGIAVLLNDGSGAFTAGPRIQLAAAPESLVAADFDRDRFPDLAVALTDGAIHVLPNLGGGSFGPPAVVSSGGPAWGLIAADLDRDGRADLAARNPAGKEVLALMSRGGGSFDAARLPVDGAPHALAAADADSDGFIDLAVGIEPGEVLILRNAGAGSFSTAGSLSLGTAPETIAPLDADGDGWMDLLVVFADRPPAVLLNEGTGFLPIAVASVPSGSSPVPADVDVDGRTDLVLAGGRLGICFNVPPVPSRDCDGNCVPDECEPDCNRNGIKDSCDIASGTSADCNGNGIPDECEADCNHNRIFDACDIASGKSGDCNGNGIPDECEPDCDGSGVADVCKPDCNGNGVPDVCEPDCDGDGAPDACAVDCDGNGVIDSCDIAGGGDCDGDGRVDACEIAAGVDPDCDGNGVPDSCEGDPALILDAPPAYLFDLWMSHSVAADLDGDGDLDIAAGPPPENDRALSLLVNDGSGRFAVRAVKAEVYLMALAWGDFDRDGLADLAVAGQEPGGSRSRLIALINRGTIFEASMPIPLGGAPLSLESADLDLDGSPDLCAAIQEHGAGRLSVFLGGGKGDFTPGWQAALPRERSFRIADLDGDGDPDLAIGHSMQSGENVVTVIRNDGKAVFETPPDPSSPEWNGGYLSLEAEDIDGDGLLDLVGSGGSDEVDVFLNRGGGAFERRPVIEGEACGGAAIADLDGDGDADIVVMDCTVVRFLFNEGAGSFAESGSFVSRALWLHPGDFDGDGEVDLAFHMSYVGLVMVARNRGGGAFFLSEEVLSAGERFKAMAEVTDMDADGRADIIARAVEEPGPSTSGVILWNGADGRFAEETEVIAGVKAMVSGDFDGDGLRDLAAWEGKSISTIVQEGPRVFRAKASCPVECEANDENGSDRIVAADLDGDGDLDLVPEDCGPLSALWNDGTGRFAIEVLGPGESQDHPWRVVAGDLDGDGWTDLVIGEYEQVSIRSGSSGFTDRREQGIHGRAVESMALLDLERDGDIDLALIDGYEVVLLENAGGVLSDPREIPTAPSWDLLARDMEGDGDEDLVLASGEGVGLFLNDGRGRFGERYFATGGLTDREAGFAAVGDLDGDGDGDVVTLAGASPPYRIAILRSFPWRADADGNGVPDSCERGARFLRGDATGGGALDLSDAIVMLEALFLGGPPVGCEDAADSNDDGVVDISDPVALLWSLFLGAGRLPPPSAGCAFDPTPDGLGCGKGC